MNNLPDVSVIMSIHNGRCYLDKAIESILNQSLSNFEFIIINDKSLDNSEEIIHKYQQQDNRIVIIDNESNIGLTKSLNRGIGIARGRYIARQDADDISLYNRLIIQYNFLEQHPDIFLCSTEFDYVDAKDIVIKRNFSRYLSTNQIEIMLGRKNCLLHPTIMFRNDGLYYRDKFYYAQDYDFYLTILTQGRHLALLPDKLVQYRWNPLAISSQKRNKQKAFAAIARKFYHQRKTDGYDEYASFDPNKILSLQNDVNNESTLLTDIIKFYLQNNQPEKARTAFQQYHSLADVSTFTNTALSLFITFPWFYRIYRRLRYNHDR